MLAVLREHSSAPAASPLVPRRDREPLRTLVATIDCPWPAVSGADLRNWQNVLGARALGPTVAAFLGSSGAPEEREGVVFRALTDLPPGAVWRHPADSVTSAVEVPPEAVARFAAIMRDFAPHAIVFAHPALHALLPTPRPSGVRVILDFHNVESAVAARTTRVRGLLRPRRWLDARAAARASAHLERAAMAVADAAWVCSPDEESRLRAVVGPARIHVVPNGIPRAAAAGGVLRPSPNGGTSPFTLAFVGHLGYAPNVAAAHWLAQRLMPALRRRLDAQLVIAGRSPAAAVRALANGAVKVTADPTDIEPILAAADFAVLPLREGGGTRFKALEAMSRGLPLIATAFAVEGLGLAEGTHYRRAETVGGFARAIAGLAADRALRERLRGAAWQHALAHFGPSAVARAVREGLVAA